jgi:hypothetical protein
VKLIHYVLLTIGLGWLAADLNVIVSHIILRETRIGVVATFLDKLPRIVGTPIFIFLWITLLFGWVIPIGLSVRPLFRRRKAN